MTPADVVANATTGRSPVVWLPWAVAHGVMLGGLWTLVSRT